MATEEYANSATTTVSSGGTTAPSGGTVETWTVASSVPFPAASTGSAQFHVADPAFPAELILVTNISGTTWTVTRGAESTTPVTHTAGFTIWLVVTAADLTAMASGGTLPVRSVTSGTTVASTDGLLLIDATSGSLAIGLPSPAPVTGKVFYLKRIDTGTNYVTLNPFASELIDGGYHGYVANSGACMALVSDGTNWWTL